MLHTTNDVEVFPVIVPVSNWLRTVNFYLVKQEDSLTLIDAGLSKDKYWGHLHIALEEHGFEVSDITEIILTHHHTDHVGLINRILAEHPIPVYVHPYAIPKLKSDPDFLKMRLDFFKKLYREMGCKEFGDKVADYMYQMAVKEKDKKPNWEFREILNSPLLDFEIINIPGHSPDQLAFYNQERAWLFTGDLVIEHMSSNAFVEPDLNGNRPKVLVQHKESLEKCLAHPATIFPGHGNIIEAPAPLLEKRIKEIEDRANTYLEIIKSGVSTGAEIAQQHFKNRYIKIFFNAMSEVIGYLDYLEAEGKLDKELENGVWHYYFKF